MGRTTIVGNKVDALQYAMCSTESMRCSTYFFLTMHQTSVKNLLGNMNTFTMLIKAKKDAKKSVSLCAFCKKVNKECRKYYDLLCEFCSVDWYYSCVVLREASDMKNMLYSISRLLCIGDSYTNNLSNNIDISY